MMDQRALLADFRALPPEKQAEILAQDEQNRRNREHTAVMALREKTVANKIKFSGIPEEYKRPS